MDLDLNTSLGQIHPGFHFTFVNFIVFPPYAYKIQFFGEETLTNQDATK